ncbi:hypothetical protein [Pseudomonas sp. SST3]|uniref:hypothetical protein n=1 Tax=Pseudomonas sp. SST3 TaxID=2267882 RepID=UPI0014441ACD|nr:hypothetical protein [Pseudomonas sp. SST3]NKQ12773.1 hypothetical protein [Pseudomonas sp. SST3]
MNTATATHRIQTSCVLSLALLISGTTNAAHGPEHVGAELYRHGHESFAPDGPSCVGRQGPRVIIFDQDLRQTAPSCNTATRGSVTITPPPIRLARPLSGSQYIPSSDSIRYSF